MEENQMVVITDGTTREAATIEETYEHHGVTVARVQSDSMGGWVRLPATAETASHTLVCRECGHYDEKTEQRVGDKFHQCNHRGSAEALQQIHEAKTGHDTHIEQTA
jgi:hypothetical protein